MRSKISWIVAGFAVAAACGGDDSMPFADATGAADSGATTVPAPGATSAGVTTSTTMDDASATTGAGTADDTAGGSMTKFDLGVLPDVPSGECPGINGDATLTGTVLAPNGQIPISNALVYVANAPPPGIPQEVYCDECQQLVCENPFTFTNADGSFSLEAVSGAGKHLVVQKGQFMRVTPIDVAAGATALDAAVTTLPGATDPAAGEYVPKIAVGYGSYDRIEDALAKFGLGQTSIANMEETLVPGTEPFDIWDNGGGPTFDGYVSQGTFAQLVDDPNALAQYHIIFVPCSSDEYVSSLGPAQIQNIQDWVAAGGRWYVADWSNEWFEHVFPDYQTLEGEPNAADGGVYDSNAAVLDPDLLAWLQALPAPLKDINPLNDESHPTLFDLPAFVTTVDNWSVIEQVHPVLVDDGMGGQEDVGHKVWLEGPGGGFGPHPLTVAGRYGCGRIQFTSYHAAEFFDYVGLSPQELVLLYTILEIGVCQDNPLPPPG